MQASYDYNAPIDEAGRTTEKYRALANFADRAPEYQSARHPGRTAGDRNSRHQAGSKEPLLQTLPRKPSLVSAQNGLDGRSQPGLRLRALPQNISERFERQTRTQNSARTTPSSWSTARPSAPHLSATDWTATKLSCPKLHGPATLDLLVYNLGRISVVVTARHPASRAQGTDWRRVARWPGLERLADLFAALSQRGQFQGLRRGAHRPDLLSRHIHRG